MFWKQWFKKKESKKSQLTLLVEVFNNLKPSSLNNVFSSDMSIFRLTVAKPTIEEYCDLLKFVTRAIEEDRLLYATQIAFEVKSVYIRDFFTTKKQMMVDPVSTVTEFIDLVVKFLTLYESKELSNDKTFNTEKNLMLTQNIVSNLYVLSKEL